MIDKRLITKIIYFIISLSLIAGFFIFILPLALIAALGFLIAIFVALVILRYRLKKGGIKVKFTYQDNNNKDPKHLKDVTNS